MDPEVRLSGGYVNPVVRIGDTVRRPQGPRARFVHRLLRHLEESGFEAAPRFVGVDERGREILSYVDGHVAWEATQPEDVWSETSLRRVAQLVRDLHDLTAGTELAGDQEVVCHNDLSPRNTVYRGDGDGFRPVAFIDWDNAGPGPRLHDVGYMCWQYLGLGPSRPDPEEPARLVHLMCDAYGDVSPEKVLDAVLAAQSAFLRGIEEAALAGDEAARRLKGMGACDSIRADREWVDRHRAELVPGPP